MEFQAYAMMMPENRRWLSFALIGGVVLGLVWLMGVDWGSAGRIRIAQSLHDERIDANLDLGTALAAQTKFQDLQWEAHYAGDTQYVSAIVRVSTFQDFPQELTAELRHLVAMTREWERLVDEYSIKIRIVVRIDARAGTALGIDSIRMDEAWVVYSPNAVEKYEEALEESLRLTGSSSEKKAYRLRHEDGRALFNAGLLNPALAGPGMRMDGETWIGKALAWKAVSE